VGYCGTGQISNDNLQLLQVFCNIQKLNNKFKRGAHGIMVVYDITDRESFENIKMWIGEIEKLSILNQI